MGYGPLHALFYKALHIVGPLGELWLTLPFAAVLVVWCLISREYRGAIAVAGAVLGTLALVVVIKLIATLVGPPWRPHWEYISSLFPSGHAAMGTVVYGALALCVARALPRFGAACAIAVVALMALLSVQRVVSGSHPPLDVVGGVAFGLVALYGLWRAWPTGSLRPVGLPAGAVAAVFILHGLYGREIPSAQMLEHASARIHAAVATLSDF